VRRGWSVRQGRYVGGARSGFPWANEVSEYALYGITLLTAKTTGVFKATDIGKSIAYNSLSDPTTPLLQQPFYYLVRAQNSCPQGNGPLGSGSNGAPRAAIDCP